MNQEEEIITVSEEQNEGVISPLRLDTPDSSASSLPPKEDVGNPFHIEASDREIQKAFQTGFTSLLTAKKMLTTQLEERVDSQPFHTKESKENAHELVKAIIQTEICACRLIMSVTRTPSNPKSKNVQKEYTIDDLRDIAGLVNYLTHIRRTHNGHLDQLLQLSNQLLHSSEARFEIAEESMKERVVCETHPDRKAVGKSLANGKFQCGECITNGQ